MGPIQKSKDKTKGAHRLKSNDRLISWQAVDGGPGLNPTGLAATGLLDHLSYDFDRDEESYDHGHDASGDNAPEMENDGVDVNGVGVGFRIVGDDHDNHMSLYEEELVLNQVEGDGGWCLVGGNISLIE